MMSVVTSASHFMGLSVDVSSFLKLHGVGECGMILTAEQGNTGRKICTSVTLFTTNPTWTGLGCNMGFCGDRPATDRLTYGTAD